MNRKRITLDPSAPAGIVAVREAVDGEQLTYRDAPVRGERLTIRFVEESPTIAVLSGVVVFSAAWVGAVYLFAVADSPPDHGDGAFLWLWLMLSGIFVVLFVWAKASQARGHRGKFCFEEGWLRVQPAAPDTSDIVVQLSGIRRVEIVAGDAGVSLYAKMESGERIPIAREIPDRRYADYIAAQIASESNAAKARFVERA